MTAFNTIACAQGTLTTADVRAYARSHRKSAVGPTTVYYAGVVAPAITAAMATLVGAVLSQAGWSSYWSVLTAAIIACLAGITWYLIFVRWSYRHTYGRGEETGSPVTVSAGPAGIDVERRGVLVRASWSAVKEISQTRRYIVVALSGTDDALIPASWFESKADMARFKQDLDALYQASTAQCKAA